jgi:hypothetical protein
VDDGYAGSHEHGDGRELPDVAGAAAGGTCDCGQEDAGKERHAGAEPSHQQRTGHGGNRKHQHWQRDQESNLCLRHLKVVPNERDHRWNGQDRDPCRDAGEPQKGEQADKLGVR